MLTGKVKTNFKRCTRWTRVVWSRGILGGWGGGGGGGVLKLWTCLNSTGHRGVGGAQFVTVLHLTHPAPPFPRRDDQQARPSPTAMTSCKRYNTCFVTRPSPWCPHLAALLLPRSWHRASPPPFVSCLKLSGNPGKEGSGHWTMRRQTQKHAHPHEAMSLNQHSRHVQRQ